MISWFRKKDEKPRKVELSGNVGTIDVPPDLIVQDEDDSTVLAYPPGEEKITLRFSSLSFEKKGDDESAGRAFIRKKAGEDGLRYFEIGDKGILTYAEESGDEGAPLVIHYWEVGAGNSIVIITATVVKAKQNDRTVRKTLEAVPAMLESLRITKSHRVIQGDSGEVKVTERIVDPTPQTVAIFDGADLDWLRTNLEQARILGLRYGSGGELGPGELDRVFSRWMGEQGEKEEGAQVADALGAAFGAFLVEHHGFEWVVVTDEYGTEYAVKHRSKDSIAFPRASVEKRIEDKEPEFFQNVYLLILDTLRTAGE